MGLKDTAIVLGQLYTERAPCDACRASLNRPGYTETAVFSTVPDATDVSRAVALMRAYGRIRNRPHRTLAGACPITRSVPYSFNPVVDTVDRLA